MRDLWREFRTFLVERVVLWLLPLVLLFGFLTWLAWRQAAVPSSPFTYEVF